MLDVVVGEKERSKPQFCVESRFMYPFVHNCLVFVQGWRCLSFQLSVAASYYYKARGCYVDILGSMQ